MVEETFVASQHEIKMMNRNTMELTGVTRIESFDSQEFLLHTDYGYLGVRGQDLHIKNLDLDVGCVSIEGQITDISYLDVAQSRSEKNNRFFGRLFR